MVSSNKLHIIRSTVLEKDCSCIIWPMVDQHCEDAQKQRYMVLGYLGAILQPDRSIEWGEANEKLQEMMFP